MSQIWIFQYLDVKAKVLQIVCRFRETEGELRKGLQWRKACVGFSDTIFFLLCLMTVYLMIIKSRVASFLKYIGGLSFRSFPKKGRLRIFPRLWDGLVK